MNVRFEVEFRGDAPDPVRVGDVIDVVGKFTVRAIEADMIDITSYGTDEQTYMPGDTTVRLLANRAVVRKA